MLPVFIFLENLAAEVRKLNIRSCLKWKGAVHSGFKAAPSKILGDEILGQFDNIISQFRQRSKIRAYLVWYSSAEFVIKKAR
jgi:hypothetical protein